MTFKKLLPLSELKRQLKEHGILDLFWGIDDVRYCIVEGEYQKNFFITEDEAETIARFVVHGFDANIGVNWDVIYSNIDMYLWDKPLQQRNKIVENCVRMGFIFTDELNQKEALINHLELAHKKQGLDEQVYKETVEKYFNSINHIVGDSFNITYLKSGVEQIKILISDEDHINIIKPNESRKLDINLFLDDKKWCKKKSNKVEMELLKEELNIIQDILKDYNFEYFTDKSPLYEAIRTARMTLPETQGGIHDIVMTKI